MAGEPLSLVVYLRAKATRTLLVRRAATVPARTTRAAIDCILITRRTAEKDGAISSKTSFFLFPHQRCDCCRSIHGTKNQIVHNPQCYVDSAL
jgi:hypothetical protein